MSWARSSSWKICSSLAAAFACTTLQAKEIIVRLPQGMEVEVWVLPTEPEQLPVAGRKFKVAQFSLEIPKESETGVIVLHDTQKQNLAMKRVSALDGYVWQVKPGDWRIATAVVEVFAKGDVMPKGSVEANSGAFGQTQKIENGKATFFAVPKGDVQFVVHYTSGGADKKAPQQTFRFDLTRKEPVPTVAIAVRDTVDGPSPNKSAGEAKAEDGGSPMVNLLIIAAGLGAVLGGLYSLLRWMKSNPEKAQVSLKKLGIDPVTPAEPEVAPIAIQLQPLVPEGHCEFCGKPTAECICNRTVSSAAPAGVPRLVSGDIRFEIGEGTIVIGREGDLAIDDATVSRRHAEIRQANGVVTLFDLGSSNGTFVNGSRIDRETVLKPGDTIQFGAVRLRFEG